MKHIGAYFLLGLFLAAVLAAVPALVLFYGFTVSSLWGWFVVPFFGAPQMPIAIAIGLYTFTRLVFGSRARPEKPEREFDSVAEKVLAELKDHGTQIPKAFGTPALFLLTGAIAKSFV